MTSTPTRVSYRQVLAIGEFRALFACQGLSVIGDHVARIAIALLVYDRTGSAFAASATYGCSFLTWVVGGPVLSALADRHRRRRLMISADLARCALLATLLVPHPPLWLVFTVLVAAGLLAPPFESARSALLPDLLTGEEYLTGNALINTTFQGAQVGGFLLGGLLVAAISVRGALAVDAVSFLVSAGVLARAVAERARPVASDGSLLADVWAGLRLVRRDRYLRGLLAYGILASVVAIVPEGLAVTVAAKDGAGAVGAGILTATLPLGYVLASAWVLHLPAARRGRLLRPLSLLLCGPLLVTPVVRGLPVTALLWLAAGLGTAVQLIASVSYVAGTPPEFRGRAFGVASTALMLAQGGSLLLAGAVADLVGARLVVAAAAGMGLVALLGLRGTLAGAQG